MKRTCILAFASAALFALAPPSPADPVIAVDVPIARPRTVAFSPDGRQIAVGGVETVGDAPNDGLVLLMAADTGKQQALMRHSGTVRGANGVSAGTHMIHALAYSPDGNLLAVASEKGLKLFQPADGAEVATLAGYKPGEYLGGVYSIAISPNGKLLAASLGSPSRIGLWDLASHAQVRDIDGVSQCDLKFSPDGSWLASAEHHNRVHLWRISDGRQIAEVHAEMGTLNGISIDASGTSVGVGGEGGEKMWTIEAEPNGDTRFTGEVRLTGQAEPVDQVAFTPDGRLLATTSRGAVVVYDAQSHSILGTLTPGGPFAFSPDGRRIVVVEAGHGQNISTQLSIWTLDDVLAPDRLAEQALAAAQTLVRLASSGQPDFDEQRGAMAALSGIKAPAAALLLMDALSNPDVQRKELLAPGLGRLAAENPEVVEALAKAIREDENIGTRVAAAMALATITPEAAKPAVPTLIVAALDESSPRLQRIALQVLERLDPEAFRDTAASLAARRNSPGEGGKPR